MAGCEPDKVIKRSMDDVTLIATWFVGDTAETATFFPQVGRTSDDPKAQSVYWRCVAVFYATSIAANPAADHYFFTNVSVPVVDGFDISLFLERAGVRVIKLPITYRLKSGAVESWGNQFYIVDIIDYICGLNEYDSFVILDSDCVWLDSVSGLASEARTHGVATYDMKYLDPDVINGVSQRQLACFSNSVTGSSFELVRYCGGEIFAASSQELGSVRRQLHRFWFALCNQEEPALREEAHLLSCVYAVNGYPVGTANKHIKRMWTTFGFSNISLADFDLAIWHLPAEKNSGFARAYELLRKSSTGSNPLGEFAAPSKKLLGGLMGVPKRDSAKLLRDGSRKVVGRLFGKH